MFIVSIGQYRVEFLQNKNFTQRVMWLHSKHYTVLPIYPIVFGTVLGLILFISTPIFHFSS